ncbi:VCBS repeat-containing protein [bacterium]|nr:VCBS repeat-containing protein [bacterium]
MFKILKKLPFLLFVFIFACGGGSSDDNNETPDENIPNEDSDNNMQNDDSDSSDASVEETDKDGDDTVSDEDSKENDDETTDEDAAFEELQTGGIYIFSDFDAAGNAQSRRILGNGGFLGFSIFSLGEKYWAVSAIHESIPAFDWDNATGRLYIFDKNKRIESLYDAAFVLNHPEKTLNVGFGYTAAAPCDINGDGLEDLVVSSHLAAFGELYAAGEIVVFYGTSNGWNEETFSISRLSSKYIQKADSMSQSLACLDYDGDGFADIFAGGQNAGPELPGGGSQGMVAFFKGTPAGLSENESWVLLPEVEERAQYFGSGMIIDDLDGDSMPDLAVAGWGLRDEYHFGGGIYIYSGGTDWQKGATHKIFWADSSQFGSVIKTVEIGGRKYLAALAPNDNIYGTVSFFDPEENFEPILDLSFLLPSYLYNDDNKISDFDTIKISEDTDLIIAGGKNFGDGGQIFCATVKDGTLSEPEACKFQPELPEGGFGNTVFNNGNGEIVVGMPEYVRRF